MTSTTTNLSFVNSSEEQLFVCCINCVQPCNPISVVKYGDGDDATENIQTTTTTTIDVISALAKIFKLNHLPKFNLNKLKDNGTGVCEDCARVLGPLVQLYEKFSFLRQSQSFLSKYIREVDELIWGLDWNPNNHHNNAVNFDTVILDSFEIHPVNIDNNVDVETVVEIPAELDEADPKTTDDSNIDTDDDHVDVKEESIIKDLSGNYCCPSPPAAAEVPNSTLNYNPKPSSSSLDPGLANVSSISIKNINPIVKLARLTASEIFLSRLGTTVTQGQRGKTTNNAVKGQGKKATSKYPKGQEKKTVSESVKGQKQKTVSKNVKGQGKKTVSKNVIGQEKGTASKLLKSQEVRKDKDQDYIIDNEETNSSSSSDDDKNDKRSFSNHIQEPHSDNLFQCITCSLAFASPNSLREHFKEIHHHCPIKNITPAMVQPFKCKDCRLFYPTLDELEAHRPALCHPTKNWTPEDGHLSCPICSNVYPNPNSLQSHTRDSHFSAVRHRRHQGPVQCNLCDKLFASPHTLRKHQVYLHRSELGLDVPEPHPCPHCSKMFRSSTLLRTHICCVHDKLKPFICQYCARQFAQDNSLKKHLLIHTNEKPFECPDCHKKFRHKVGLTSHQDTLHSDNVYLCSLCGRQFNSKKNLRRHALVHTEEKPYPCTLCPKRFKCSEKLKQHMRQRGAHRKVENIQKTSRINKSVAEIAATNFDSDDEASNNEIFFE